MITSTYGVKLPEDGDIGQPIFDAINSNSQKFIDHTHNGTNSAAIAASALTKGTVNLSAVDWTVTAGGNGYKQTVTLPGAHTLPNSILRFRVRSGTHLNKIIHPTVIPISATQFDVVVNDNTLALEVLCV